MVDKVGANIPPPKVEEEVRLNPPKPGGTRATYAAVIETAASGGSLKDIEDLRDVYNKHGKSKEFQAQVDLWKYQKNTEAKNVIYERLAQRYPPEQITLDDPAQQDEAFNAIADYNATNNVEGLDVAVRGALHAAIPEPTTTNAHEYSIQMRLAGNAQKIAGDLSRGFASREGALATAWGGIDWIKSTKDFITETPGVIVSAGRMFTPLHDEAVAYDALRELGVPFDPSQIAAGEAFQKAREYLVALPYEKQAEAILKLANYMEKHPLVYDDAIMYDIYSSLYTDEMLYNNDPTAKLDRIFRNIGTIGNVVAFAGIGRTLNWAGKLISKPSIRLLASTNRKAAQRTMAALMTELDQSKVLTNWGTKTSEISLTQLPKPGIGPSVNLPDGVAEAAAHINDVRGDIEEVLKNSREDLFTNQEILGAVEREAQRVQATFGGKLRLGRSEIALLDDKSGVRFGSVIGSSDTHGFSDFESARKYAETLDPSGKSVKVLEVQPDQTLKSIASGDALQPGAYGNRAGEFYVQHDQNYFFRPEDKLLFGDDPVVAPTWLGRAALWVGSPTSVFNREVTSKTMRAFLNEQALAADMDRLVAPFFKDLSWKEQQNVSQMWQWTEQFGKRENRIPTWDELQEAFPDITNKELTGWYYMRQYFDTVYHISNDRVYRDFAARGHKTLRAGGTQYHGKVLERSDMGKYSNDGVYTVYDPIANTEMNLNRGQLDKLYKDGGSVVEVDIPVSSGPNGGLSTLILHHPGNGTQIEALSKFPLKYTPGYYPRMYKDQIFVRRRVKAGRINGRTTEHTQAVAVAPDARSAEELATRLNETRGDDTIEYVVDQLDPRLSDRDRIAKDLESMQLEGRIFYDNRNADPLASVSGGQAEVVDPINAMLRTGRMLSRQVATEDLVRTMKTQWQEQYGHLLQGDITSKTSAEVSAAMDSLARQSRGAHAKEAAQGQAMWDYIRVMEGSLYGGGTGFRRMAVRASEFLQNSVLPKGSRVGTLLARNAEKFAPVEWMKSLAFFDFMTTRPLRQLFLQGSQHLFIQALDPTYAGKWQMDTFLLMSGARGRNLRLAGLSKEHKFLRTRNAKMMGISVKEYDKLVSKFNQSGLAQAVNLHTFASDVLPEARQVPTTGVGRAADVAVGVVTARPVRRQLNKWGFQAGEGYNVASSYMMAVRRTLKENGYDKISQLTDEDWAAITPRASNYAMAMHRANASKYQYGLLSLPMQFLSFTHKVFLTFLQALPGNIGNKGFTKSEARKILAGQFLMFGGAGFGLKDEAEKFLINAGMDKYLDGEVVDFLAGGFLDMVLDAAIQKATDDPELDLPFDEFLAPGANVINVARSFWEAGTEKVPVETLLGPSAQTTSRLVDAAMIGREMTRTDFPEWTPEEELRIVLDATLQGFASGYGDYLKARLAWKTGELLSQAGVPHKYNASREEALAKGLFGITSTGQKELWALTKDMRERQKDLDSIAATYHERILNLTRMYANEDTYTHEYFRNRIALERSLLMALPPEERTYVMERFNQLEKRRRTENAGIGDYIMQALSRNGPTPAQWLVYRLNRSPAVAEEDKATLSEQILKHDQSLREAGELWDQKLERSDETVQMLQGVKKNGN